MQEGPGCFAAGCFPGRPSSGPADSPVCSLADLPVRLERHGRPSGGAETTPVTARGFISLDVAPGDSFGIAELADFAIAVNGAGLHPLVPRPDVETPGGANAPALSGQIAPDGTLLLNGIFMAGVLGGPLGVIGCRQVNCVASASGHQALVRSVNTGDLLASYPDRDALLGAFGFTPVPTARRFDVSWTGDPTEAPNLSSAPLPGRGVNGHITLAVLPLLAAALGLLTARSRGRPRLLRKRPERG